MSVVEGTYHIALGPTTLGKEEPGTVNLKIKWSITREDLGFEILIFFHDIYLVHLTERTH